MIIQRRDRRDGVFGVTGDAINTAARLAREAARDEVLVGPDTYRAIRDALRDRVRRTAATARQVGADRRAPRAAPRGAQAQPRPVASGTGSAAGAPSSRRCAEPSRRPAAAAPDSSPSRASPGVGKTRLFQEFAARVSPERSCCTASAPRFGSVAPYQPFRDVLRDGAAARRRRGIGARARGRAHPHASAPACEAHLPSLLALLSIQMDAQPIPAEAASDRLEEANLAALHSLLRALARERGVVLLLEDWHWADPGLRGGARAPGPEPARASAARARQLPIPARADLGRRGAAPRARAARRRRHARDRAAHPRRRARSRCCGASRSARAAIRCSSRSCARPCASSAPSAGWRRTVVGDVVPDTVAAVVRARIDRLTPAQVELLKLASVLGEEFPRALLEQLCGSRPRRRRPLEGLVRAELLQEQRDGETCRFKHAIVQDVAYAMLLHQRRRALHAAVGRLIEDRGRRARRRAGRAAGAPLRAQRRAREGGLLPRALRRQGRGLGRDGAGARPLPRGRQHPRRAAAGDRSR